jgi:hypothetical protein
MPVLLLFSALITLHVAEPGQRVCMNGVRGPRPVLLVDDALRTLYERGRSYEDFLAAADQRVELWQANTAKSEDLDADLVRRARAVGGSWRLLAVAIASCSDSVSTIPHLARLAAQVDGLDMRIVDNRAGRAVMDAHPTPDGRPATPTVLLLDADWNEAGCFIERPPALQTWILENPDSIAPRDMVAHKMAWYAEDSGRQTVEAIVEAMEAAAAGEVLCR